MFCVFSFHCTDSSAFLIYNEAHNKCMKVVEPNVAQASDCDLSSDTQHFRWISSSRILSISHKLCLGAQDLKEWVRVVLLPCNELSPMQIWECKNETLFGIKGQTLHLNYGNRHEPNLLLYSGTGSWSRWEIYGSKNDLCSHGYQGRLYFEFVKGVCRGLYNASFWSKSEIFVGSLITWPYTTDLCTDAVVYGRLVNLTMYFTHGRFVN